MAFLLMCQLIILRKSGFGHGVQGVAGSSPVAPTFEIKGLR
jgi:hypothetical protein